MANIPIKNIYYMLSYAYQTLHETGNEYLASEEFDHIHDLFAAILVHGITAQVKRGLYREYVEQVEILSGLRGRIIISETIKKQTQRQGRLVCSFDEFSVDSPHNQALKSVLLLLLRHGDVKPKNRQSIRKLLPYLSDVKEIEPRNIRWDALRYHRHNASYRMLIGICRLTVKGMLISPESGSFKLTTWLQDEAMSRLFEKFVLEYYRKHRPYYDPREAQIKWDLADSMVSNFLPVMKSDITMKNGIKHLIIDTKFYEKGTMQYNSRYDKKSYHSHNLYQMYAYVKNSDKTLTGNVAGIILYAKTDEEITPDEDLFIGGNKISVMTLDLNQTWSGIKTQLDSLCNWLSIQ